MPFTIAHTAAAAPLWRLTRRRLMLSAVVVGSVAPDLEYLVHLDTHRTIGHTLPGVFVLCLPVSLVVLAVWHGLVKRPLVSLVGSRWLPPIDLRPFPFAPASRFVAVCGSILAGTLTHLLWDSFTHRDGFITTRVDLLMEAVGRPHVYDLLNYASSALGVALLLVAWWRAMAPCRAPAPPPARMPTKIRAAGLTAIAVVSLAGGAANAIATAMGGWGMEATLQNGILGTMAAATVVIVAVSAVLHRRVTSGGIG